MKRKKSKPPSNLTQLPPPSYDESASAFAFSSSACFPPFQTSFDPARISASSNPAMARSWPLARGLGGRFLNQSAEGKGKRSTQIDLEELKGGYRKR